MSTFEQLKPEYTKLWASMTIRPDKAETVTAIARKLIAEKDTYQAVQDDTGVPWFVIAALHERESDADFTTYLGNGEPLNRVTTIVPRGRGPWTTWEEGAVDALALDGLDKVDEWTPERACFEIEKFNGFGYQNNHPEVKSPYLWSFSNHYTSGKYIADGQFVGSRVDLQCGAIPVLKRIMELDSTARFEKGAPAEAPKPAGKNWLQALIELLLKLFARKPAEPPDLAARIVAGMKKRGMKLDTGLGQRNAVYVRNMGPDGVKNAGTPNQFNCSRYVIGFDTGKPKIMGAWEATTVPGRKWTMSPMDRRGAARTVPGQYTAWRVGVIHPGTSGAHEAMMQCADVKVDRDLNKNFKDDDQVYTAGPECGICQHWGYDLPHDDLGGSSAGCLVGRVKDGHRQYMSLMKSDPRYVADHNFIFTAALLLAAEIA